LPGLSTASILRQIGLISAAALPELHACTPRMLQEASAMEGSSACDTNTEVLVAIV
jgi:hypothetical protein